MESIYTAFFQLKNNYNWSFLELYNLPVALRKWFIDKYLEEAKKQKEKNNIFETT